MSSASLSYFRRPPRFFLAAILLFWGIQIGLWQLALIMAILAESPYFIPQRWHIPQKDAYRLADIISIILFLSAIYLFSKNSSQGLFILLQWLPIFLFLLLLLQLYSDKNYINLSVLMWSLRKENNILKQKKLNFCYPYAALCLLAASPAQQNSYFWGICLFSTWALWAFRPTHYPYWRWLLLLLIVAGLGFWGQQSLRHLQQHLEQLSLIWLENFWHDRDPYKAQTAIGDIGSLKLSNKILMRIQSKYPLLLRQASYDTYTNGIWRARYVRFHYLNNNKAGVWFLNTNQAATTDLQQIKIETKINKGKGVLALPAGSYRLELPAGIEIQQNKYDRAVTLYEAPPLLGYKVSYTADEIVPLELKAADDYLHHIPAKEQPVIQQIAQQLDLFNPDLNQREKIERIAQFFADNFYYSLNQTNIDLNSSPISQFLTDRKRGHCEYFATSTTLLLRAAGIPSRYAVGYAVQEYNFLEQAYVVRRRHAHAWALAYVNGKWLTVDTTPSNWYDEEAAATPWWLSIYDMGSWLKYRFDRWRWLTEERDGKYSQQLLAIAIILILWLLSRVYQRSQIRVINKQKLHTSITLKSDSPFDAIISYFRQQNHAPHTYEPLGYWLQRLYQHKIISSTDYQQLQYLLILHYRYRFEPKATSTQELETQVKNWLIT